MDAGAGQTFWQAFLVLWAQVTGSRRSDGNAVSRVLPISSIRFVLAMWVVLSHFGIPVLREHRSLDFLWILRAIVNTAFNGPAAVIVFFVISGFCIHFPNRKGIEIRSWR